MATYAITCLGSWPVNRGGVPLTAEAFHVERDGEAVRPVAAITPYSELRGLQGDLERRDGLNEEAARAQARYVLRHLGWRETRRLAEEGRLRQREGDTFLQVAVRLDSGEARTLARSPDLRLVERDQNIDAFEVQD
jgi:hypothetical protein